jgi:hypothetical protein
LFSVFAHRTIRDVSGYPLFFSGMILSCLTGVSLNP